MKLFVVDASVAVKWFLPEVKSKKALEILDEEAALIAPGFLKLEFDSVLSKWCRSGRLDNTLSDEIRQTFRDLNIKFIDHDAISELAYHYASNAPVTLYDALYLMTAELYQGVLVTADGKLAESVSGLHQRKLIRLI